MSENRSDSILQLHGWWINLLSVVLGIAAAYFMTIQSLKVELAAKAEGAVVGALDKRLAGIEILLTERTVSKEQFFRFSSDVEARLIRIEDHLVEYSGENLGKH
jgi:hypothetical protein